MGLRQVLLRLRQRVASGTASSAPKDATIFSFVVDADPCFAYQGYHLARSLIEHCGGNQSAIHVQFTPDVSPAHRAFFADLGCTLHDIPRFGDGRGCNKISQLDNLLPYNFGRVVLLDTDTIAIADLRPYLSDVALQAKVVDAAIPSIGALEEIARLAGLQKLPPRVESEVRDGDTYLGNCNGGFYSIPKALCATVAAAWRPWALWLLDNIDPLTREGKEMHVDQVAMWLTIHMSKLPFQPAPSNVNYFLHFASEHRLLDPSHEIALLHYHDTGLNVLGLLDPGIELKPIEQAAIEKANRQMGAGFDNVLFWDLRYARFRERGSGFGSRGENLAYKRNLLQREGVEHAASVLDFGCGDLEVVKVLNLKSYLGIDSSESALGLARAARPDWTFQRATIGDNDEAIPPLEFVLCFEVLIHQPSSEAYHRVVKLLADCTLRTLLVSGYDHDGEASSPNHMVFFYEPLEVSLKRTGRFSTVRRIGAHTSVTVFRCDV